MKNKILLSGIATLFLLLTLSCGTIMHGTTQEIGISSNPSSAKVTLNGQSYGTTPIILDLKRAKTYMVKIELAGYHTYETTLTREISGWVWGNIVFGGLIGLVIDASAGGMYRLSPEQINADLKSSQANVIKNDDGILIAVVMEADSSWEKVGTLNAME